MRKPVNAVALVLLLVAVLVAAGCGGGSRGKQGGQVTILDTEGGVDSLDPGAWYYQTDYAELGQTTQRWLYSWKPDATSPTPDLATGAPKLSNGGKTITVKIRSGIKYGPPLQNRTVKSADIKYAMERCATARVGNGYFGAYYTGITGASAMRSGKAKEISGIQTPDDDTLVIHTDKPVGILANANALALPCTVPVPKEYAQKYDKGSQSTYGQHVVATGPYMIQGSGRGTVPKSGYSPSKQLVLVRNPSWDKSKDYRPAYFNKITFSNGDAASVASRKILSGTSMMSGDYATPPTPILKQALASRRDQLEIEPSQGNRFIALNTTIKPLNNINVRKALAAVTDRNALRQTRGGPTLGPIATHFIPPQMPGFDEAGGMAGPGYDFYKNPNGDVALAMSYMKKAGYKSGRYSGPPLLVVADNQAPGKQTAEAWQAQIAKIGFKMNLREVPQQSVTSKFCGTPKLNVAICPTLAWGKDFFDPQSMLDPIFNGNNIRQSGNVNVAQANDPKLNSMMAKATSITDPAQRAKAWGQIDREATGQAFVIVWLWDNEINFASKNVKGVQSKFNSDWDFTFSSLK